MPAPARSSTLNKWIFIFIPGILLGCGNVQNIRTVDAVAGKAESANLKFMTFNLRAAGGMLNPVANPDIVEETGESLTRIAAVIDSTDPDITGLQGVRGLHQAKFIAEELNLNYVYAVHARENWWGLAVLSKYTIVSARTKIINLGGRHGDQIALTCTLDIGQKKLRVINVDFAPENYTGHVEETMPLLSPLEGPAVLLGDFGRRAEYAEMADIRKEMTAACEAVIGYNGRCIDPPKGKVAYIFVDPKKFNVLDAAPVSMQTPETSAPSGARATLKLIN
jgi:hypothetical protein